MRILLLQEMMLKNLHVLQKDTPTRKTSGRKIILSQHQIINLTRMKHYPKSLNQEIRINIHNSSPFHIHVPTFYPFPYQLSNLHPPFQYHHQSRHPFNYLLNLCSWLIQICIVQIQYPHAPYRLNRTIATHLKTTNCICLQVKDQSRALLNRMGTIMIQNKEIQLKVVIVKSRKTKMHNNIAYFMQRR